MGHLRELEDVTVAWSPEPEPAEESSHFLQELNEGVERTDAALRDGMAELAEIEASHNRVMARVQQEMPEGPEKAACFHSLLRLRDMQEAELYLSRRFAASEAAAARFAAALEAVTLANRYFLTDVIASKLRGIFFDGSTRRSPSAEARAALKGLAMALKDYLWLSPSDQNDRRIRAAWTRLEELSEPLPH